MADTFSTPVGKSVPDEEIERMVVRYQKDARLERRIPEMRWLAANAVLNGFHNYRLNWDTGEIAVNAYNPRGAVRVEIPETVNRVRRETGRMLSIMQPPTSRPVSTGNPDIWRMLRFANGALSYIYHNCGFLKMADRFFSELLYAGTAGILPYWDNNMIDEGAGQDGEINYRVVPAWQLYPFPCNAMDDDHLEGLIWSRVVGEEWVKQNAPDADPDVKMVSAGTPYTGLTGKYWNAMPSEQKGYEVRYIFFRPSRRFRQGEHVIMIGDKVYRRMGALNFWIGRRREIPIFIARYGTLTNSWWGDSYAYHIARLNRELDRMMSMLVRRAILKAHPGYLMTPIGAVNTEDFKQQIGGVIGYRPSLINPEASRPYWLTFPPGTSETDVVVNRLQGMAQDTSSQHEVTEGGSPGRIDSAAGVQALLRQDWIPNEPALKSVKQSFTSSLKMGLELAKSRWSRPRLATVSTAPGMIATQVMIDPKRIPTIDELTIDTGLDMAMDRPAKLQFMTQLASSPYRGAEPQLSAEEYRRGLQAMGIVLPGIDLVSADEETAWHENMIIFGDGERPGTVPEPDSAKEDIAVHVRVHRKFVASPEVRFGASPAVQEALAYHIRVTESLMGGPAMKDPQDDLLYRADADALGTEVALGQASALDPSAQRADLIQAMLAQGLQSVG